MDATVPAPETTDSENVVWLLSTAQSLWTKGERTEALRWVERAANAARDEGQAERAARLAATLQALSVVSPPKPAARAPMKKMFERTMQSKPPADGEDPKATPVVVQRAEPAVSVPAETRVSGNESEPPEVVLSSRHLTADEPTDVTTRRFDYPDALAALAKPSSGTTRVAARARPDDVLPAIRVWIVAGVVSPAVGARPSGATDAILLSVIPGVDLAAALAKT